MTPRPPSLGPLAVPPMVARPLTDPEQALAPAFGYLATLNRELAAIEWLIDNDAEEQP